MSPSAKPEQSPRYNALRVPQWLPEWSEVEVDPSRFRSPPPHVFYLLSLPAAHLRALAGIFRRTTEAGLARSRDLGIQRRHDAARSAEIREFVLYGFLGRHSASSVAHRANMTISRSLDGSQLQLSSIFFDQGHASW